MKSNTRYFTALVIFIFALALNASAQTVPITITSYGIKSTPRSGFGCWDHTYFGYSIDVGRTASSSSTAGFLRNGWYALRRFVRASMKLNPHKQIQTLHHDAVL